MSTSRIRAEESGAVLRTNVIRRSVDRSAVGTRQAERLAEDLVILSLMTTFVCTLPGWAFHIIRAHFPEA